MFITKIVDSTEASLAVFSKRNFVQERRVSVLAHLCEAKHGKFPCLYRVSTLALPTSQSSRV